MPVHSLPRDTAPAVSWAAANETFSPERHTMRVLPFPCIRPVPEHAAEVAALPYDVFDRAEARLLRTGPPAFVLNIDRPETQFAPDQDMYAPEVYARAAELLQGRIADGTYIADGTARTISTSSRWTAARRRALWACALSMSTRTAPSSAMSSRARTRNATASTTCARWAAKPAPSSSPIATSPYWTSSSPRRRSHRPSTASPMTRA